MESQTHIDLVKIALNYIRNIVPEDNLDFIIIDSSGNTSTVHVIGNYVPDIYYKYDNLMIIGEAKTINDFNSSHSKNQYKSYVDECKIFEGRAILVIAIPWELTATAKNHFKRVKNSEELLFDIVIVNEMGRSFVI